MKKLLLATLLVVFVLTGYSQGNGIKFENIPMKDLLAMSAKSKKPIFVDVYATWCGPCKYMSSKIFTQAKVGEYFNANFVNAKFDAEQGEGIEIAKKYGVRAYPTFLILDSTGKEIGRVVGGDEADDFIQKVKSVLK